MIKKKDFNKVIYLTKEEDQNEKGLKYDLVEHSLNDINVKGEEVILVGVYELKEVLQMNKKVHIKKI